MTVYEPLEWLARIGPAAGADVAHGCALASERAARRRLQALEQQGLVASATLLHRQPALWFATAAGLRQCGCGGLGASRISAGAFAHLLACGHVAAQIERAIGVGATLCGERELRLAERESARPLASAEVGLSAEGSPALHRPDLVAWAPDGSAIAIEVELTCKAHPRLRGIVRGWARARCVKRVIYLCEPAPERAVQRAVASEWAGARVLVLGLSRWLPEQVAAELAGETKSFVSSPA